MNCENGCLIVEVIVRERRGWAAWLWTLLYSVLISVQLDKGTGRRKTGDWCPFQFSDWRRKLQLEICVPLWLPSYWGMLHRHLVTPCWWATFPQMNPDDYSDPLTFVLVPLRLQLMIIFNESVHSSYIEAIDLILINLCPQTACLITLEDYQWVWLLVRMNFLSSYRKRWCTRRRNPFSLWRSRSFDSRLFWRCRSGTTIASLPTTSWVRHSCL